MTFTPIEPSRRRSAEMDNDLHGSAQLRVDERSVVTTSVQPVAFPDNGAKVPSKVEAASPDAPTFAELLSAAMPESTPIENPVPSLTLAEVTASKNGGSTIGRTAPPLPHEEKQPDSDVPSLLLPGVAAVTTVPGADQALQSASDPLLVLETNNGNADSSAKELPKICSFPGGPAIVAQGEASSGNEIEGLFEFKTDRLSVEDSQISEAAGVRPPSLPSHPTLLAEARCPSGRAAESLPLVQSETENQRIDSGISARDVSPKEVRGGEFSQQLSSEPQSAREERDIPSLPAVNPGSASSSPLAVSPDRSAQSSSGSAGASLEGSEPGMEAIAPCLSGERSRRRERHAVPDGDTKVLRRSREVPSTDAVRSSPAPAEIASSAWHKQATVELQAPGATALDKVGAPECARAVSPRTSRSESDASPFPVSPATLAVDAAVSGIAADREQSPASRDNDDPPRTPADRQATLTPQPAAAGITPVLTVSPQADQAQHPGSPISHGDAPGSNAAHQLASPETGARSSFEPEPNNSPGVGEVQMARMVHKAAQSEMRIGLNTAAFGNVEVHTVVHASEVGIVIGSERGDLPSLIRGELPGLSQTLQQHDLRLNQVNFQQNGFAFSSYSQGGHDSQPRSHAAKANWVMSGTETTISEATPAAQPAWRPGTALSILA